MSRRRAIGRPSRRHRGPRRCRAATRAGRFIFDDPESFRVLIARPDVPELLARAHDIAALAREQAQETESARRVGDDMVARMRQADLFRIMQPQAYGGFEYDFAV